MDDYILLIGVDDFILLIGGVFVDAYFHSL